MPSVEEGTRHVHPPAWQARRMPQTTTPRRASRGRRIYARSACEQCLAAQRRRGSRRSAVVFQARTAASTRSTFTAAASRRNGEGGNRRSLRENDVVANGADTHPTRGASERQRQQIACRYLHRLIAHGAAPRQTQQAAAARTAMFAEVPPRRTPARGWPPPLFSSSARSFRAKAPLHAAINRQLQVASQAGRKPSDAAAPLVFRLRRHDALRVDIEQENSPPYVG